MSKIVELAQNWTSSTLGILFVIAYIGSFPMAIVFGDKWDVVISIFIPTYGFWVMIGTLL
jgi:hypothetical protein